LGLQLKQGLARLQAKSKHGNEGKCEGMNLHTPKGASTLGVWSPDGLLIFKEQLQGSKPNGLKSILYH